MRVFLSHPGCSTWAGGRPGRPAVRSGGAAAGSAGSAAAAPAGCHRRRAPTLRHAATNAAPWPIRPTAHSAPPTGWTTATTPSAWPLRSASGNRPTSPTARAVPSPGGTPGSMFSSAGRGSEWTTHVTTKQTLSGVNQEAAEWARRSKYGSRELPPRSQRPSALRRPPYEDVAGDRAVAGETSAANVKTRRSPPTFALDVLPVEASDAPAWLSRLKKSSATSGISCCARWAARASRRSRPPGSS